MNHPFLLMAGIVASVLLPWTSVGAPPSAPPQSPEFDQAVMGVVWSPPADTGAARRQLTQLRNAGITALRVPSKFLHPPLLQHADTLGFRLAADLPVSYVSASALDDSLRQVRPVLTRLHRLAEHHPSLQFVGLARGANTTAASTCSVLQRWTQRVHDASLQTYYVTPFSASADKCTDAVDLVLLDTRGNQDPIARWQRWTEDRSHVGFGALGTWTSPAAARGLRQPHSPERQARYLERALGDLLDSRSPPPPTFVYRWKDHHSPTLETRRYGLHSASGSARPAGDVLKGFYTGSQRVFAFPSGTAPSAAPHTLVILGWGLLALLGGLYARNPYVRETAVRYFAAHGFYRDALEEGRDVNSTVNVLLLLTVILSVGMIATLSARIIAAQPSTIFFLEALPYALRHLLAEGLAHPILSGVLVGAVALLLLSVWMIVLTLTARSQTHFSLSQGLMLTVWPCWPALGGMLLALVAATTPPTSPGNLGVLLLIGGIGTLLAVSVRVLRDFQAVTRTSPAQALALLLPSPLVLIAAATGATVMRYDPPLALLWQLATHT